MRSKSLRKRGESLQAEGSALGEALSQEELEAPQNHSKVTMAGAVRATDGKKGVR